MLSSGTRRHTELPAGTTLSANEATQSDENPPMMKRTQHLRPEFTHGHASTIQPLPVVLMLPSPVNIAPNGHTSLDPQ